MSWYLDENNLLTHSSLIAPIDGDVFVPPYPASFWRLDNNDILDLGLLPNSIELGAFAYCSSLNEVILPESLLSIGKYSFYGTALRSVTIPNSQCTYYATSFPPGCVVTGGHLIE